mgnify:CR=1 FL=1
MTTTSSTDTVVVQALGPIAGPALLKYLREVTHPDGRPVYPDLEDRLAELIPPKHFSPAPNRETRRELGLVFDLNEVDRLLRFCRKLRHIKGSAWAGRPLELDLWQVVFVAAPLMGWRRADGSRLYRRLWLEIPRKNGKSTLAAAIQLFLLVADREPGAEVYSAASSRRQAGEVFDVAKAMVQQSPALSKRLEVLNASIVYPKTFSKYEVLSAEAGTKHGMNVHASSIDEVHVHKSRDLIETIETGTGSRTNPLTMGITTAGLDDPGSIYYERSTEAERVAKGELEDPELLVVMYGIADDDDPFAVETMRKANPGYGTSVRPEYLEGEARKARNTPARLNTYLRLHLNRRTGQVTRWLPIDIYDKSGGRWMTVDEAELNGREAYGGLDLSSSVDLTAAIFVVPSIEKMALNPKKPKEKTSVEVLDVVIRAWTPEDTLEERERTDLAPYSKWVKDGHLLTCPGDVVDYDDIERELFLLAGGIPTGYERLAPDDPYRGVSLELGALNFDRWGSKQLVNHLAEGGLEVWQMGQGFADMSAPMKELERLLRQGRIRHNGNPLLRWAFASLAVRQDPAGNIKPDRDRSTGRIDPFVALVMAIGAWMRAAEAKENKKGSKTVVSY